MLGEPQRNDGQTGDARMRLHVGQRGGQLVPVVQARAQHDLRVNLDPRGKQALEHLDAARRMPADQVDAAPRA